jgi:hypothetical protein
VPFVRHCRLLEIEEPDGARIHARDQPLRVRLSMHPMRREPSDGSAYLRAIELFVFACVARSALYIVSATQRKSDAVPTETLRQTLLRTHGQNLL